MFDLVLSIDIPFEDRATDRVTPFHWICSDATRDALTPDGRIRIRMGPRDTSTGRCLKETLLGGGRLLAVRSGIDGRDVGLLVPVVLSSAWFVPVNFSFLSSPLFFSFSFFWV